AAQEGTRREQSGHCHKHDTIAHIFDNPHHYTLTEYRRDCIWYRKRCYMDETIVIPLICAGISAIVALITTALTLRSSKKQDLEAIQILRGNDDPEDWMPLEAYYHQSITGINFSKTEENLAIKFKEINEKYYQKRSSKSLLRAKKYNIF